MKNLTKILKNDWRNWQRFGSKNWPLFKELAGHLYKISPKEVGNRVAP